MKQIGKLISYFSLIFFIQCESGQTKSNVHDIPSQSNNSIQDDSILSVEFLRTDSIQNIHLDQFRTLKKIVRQENTLKNKPDSIIVTSSDSLSKFIYIDEVFDTEEIDSMEIYGRLLKHLNLKVHPQLNTLLILYYNSSEKATNAFELLEENQFENSHTQDVFKAGGICFTLQNQLCIYPIDGCGNFKNIERIDSIISKEVFNNKNYNRLLDRCEIHKFIKLSN